ncbi:hypothetical protein CAPTEDRAFT_200548 [Capitella teleta]|uniref:Uncharacterized protein n=1 Tax=Capitella teleta TaxID=283909 RepID=R7T860_CAPTE|nr:hypothetical protein CAPTEDRAFT_200548 [Capitella teleta]|eukprot:ELT89859.1 hypothetical protein CAPTEDRAFT_200548 [Capitella teleta]
MDPTKRPLKIPPTFSTYAESHGIFDLYKRLLSQLLVEKPEDPLAFLIDLLKRDNDDVPQITILGPPASGKQSIAKMVASKLRCTLLTKDNIIEEADTELRNQAKDLIKAGRQIPVELWGELMKSRLKVFDCIKKGWVLDSFPETREQAIVLASLGIYPKHCILLNAPDTVLIERASGKRVDPKTGDIFHTTFDWPTSSDVADRLKEVPGYSESEITERLVIYHRHIDGILEAYKANLHTFNADQPKADVCSQVMTFLHSKPRTAAPHTPRIVLLGSTGSGKGVQASLLANKYGIINVSMGQLIKQCIAAESRSGQACKSYTERNMLVPDAIVLSILKERLTDLDCAAHGWVLHGYPKTREQAEQLSGAGLLPNRVFFLEIPNDSVMERLSLRATDPITGDRYHLLYNPPRTQEVKDRLKISPKDEEEAVRKRLADYHAYSEELADFYSDSQRINADQDPHTVFESIESMVVKPLPKNPNY